MNISIVLPFYNESKRITNIFKPIINLKKKIRNIEFIFVNDGSVDSSINLINDFIKKNKIKNFKIISYLKNKGKGHALKMGVLNAKYEWILTSDIDLSVELDYFLNWFNLNKLKDNTAYFASRNNSGSKIKTILVRKFIGSILQYFVNIFVDKNLMDTQCGYKLYNKKYALKTFKNLSVKGFAHDIELIFLLKKNKIKIVELPVIWKHKTNGKINIITDPLIFFIIFFKIILKEYFKKIF
jgi:dolichyl-phosphate beta-glucosyltransferase